MSEPTMADVLKGRDLGDENEMKTQTELSKLADWHREDNALYTMEYGVSGTYFFINCQPRNLGKESRIASEILEAITAPTWPTPVASDQLKEGETYWGILYSGGHPQQFTIASRCEHGSILGTNGFRYSNFHFSHDVKGTGEPRVYITPEDAVFVMKANLDLWLEGVKK